MKPLPDTQNALVLRTDFSDDDGWKSLCAAIREPVGDFRAYVDFVSEPAYDGLTLAQLLALSAQGPARTFLFVVDRTALSHPEHPILVLDLLVEPGRTFRVVPPEMWSVENNLSIGNLDFADFAGSVDRDGIFRGFPRG